MSVIEKMSIVGIRSFGPEDQNKQIIEFFKPLTLILGPNGSGKTTIIECLRYITTGDHPPNSDRGGSFVHDPKIARETEIKGQVKLQLKDVLNKKVFVTRILTAAQKQARIQVKTLDGTITRIGQNGEKHTLSSKCAEIDTEMISSLGVSKAILNNVIFCHQEESNWPLSEGKALKQKFDEIFAATRYIKALEEIRKTRNEKVGHVKIYKAEAEHLRSNRQKAEEFSQILEKTRMRLAASKDTVNEVENKMKPIQDELTDISVKESEIAGLQADLRSSETLIKTLEKSQTELKYSIQNLFSGSKEELKDEMDDFKASMTQKETLSKKLGLKSAKMETEHKELQETKSKLLEEFGKLKAEHQQHEERVASRDSKLGELSKQLGLGEIFTDLGEPLRDSQVENVLRNWKQRNNMTQQELKTVKAKHEEKENKLQNSIDKARDQKSQIDQKLKSSMQQIAKNKSTIYNINMELSHVDSLATRQDDLEEDLKETEQELKSLEESINTSDLRNDISQWQGEKKAIETKLNTLSAEMCRLQNESKIRMEIELTVKEKESKEEMVDRLRQRHKETVIHLVGHMPNQNAHDDVKRLSIKLQQETRVINKDLEKKRSHLSSLETTKKYHSDELKKKEDMLESHKNKIFEVCGSQNFDEGLDVLERTVKELQDEKGALTGSLYIYNKYIEKLQSRKPCCPLCNRGFSEEEDAQALVTDLQRKLQMVPSQLDNKKRLINEHQQRLNSMLQLKPLKEAVVHFEEKEIPELKEKLTKVSENIAKLKTEIYELEEVLENKIVDQQTASSIVPDLILLDQNQRELDRIERRLSTLTCQLGGRDVSRTVQQVSEEQTSLQAQKDALIHDIESNQQRISEHSEQVQRLRGRINDLKSEKVEIASGLQKRNALMEQLSNLTSENKELDVSIKTAKEETKLFDNQIKDLITEKAEATTEKELELDEIRNKINNQQKEIDSINILTKDINRYVREGREKHLANHEKEINTTEVSIEHKNEELNDVNSQRKNLKEEIISQQLKYRELDDNRKLIETADQIKELKIKHSKLKDCIGGFNIRTLLERKRNLIEQEKTLTGAIKECEGRQGELKTQVANIQKQLQDKMFKDADKKHREKLIQLRTTELVCEDLNKYYIALDRAIMRYHSMKMNEINKIIRELWIKTYAGNDIDYIEIRSSEDESGLEKAKRVYNYKVVMVKGDTAIDMRGRCSAGQKVLASLIIRLALAETFCLNCGILALDEPTTNLDRENISKLAQALVDIVQSRLEQKNFQLIIITHDEDFIELLGRSETVDYFYKVSKDNNGFSRLSKCIISEMA